MVYIIPGTLDVSDENGTDQTPVIRINKFYFIILVTILIMIAHTISIRNGLNGCQDGAFRRHKTLVCM